MPYTLLITNSLGSPPIYSGELVLRREGAKAYAPAMPSTMSLEVSPTFSATTECQSPLETFALDEANQPSVSFAV